MTIFDLAQGHVIECRYEVYFTYLRLQQQFTFTLEKVQLSFNFNASHSASHFGCSGQLE